MPTILQVGDGYTYSKPSNALAVIPGTIDDQYDIEVYANINSNERYDDLVDLRKSATATNYIRLIGMVSNLDSGGFATYHYDTFFRGGAEIYRFEDVVTPLIQLDSYSQVINFTFQRFTLTLDAKNIYGDGVDNVLLKNCFFYTFSDEQDAYGIHLVDCADFKFINTVCVGSFAEAGKAYGYLLQADGDDLSGEIYHALAGPHMKSVDLASSAGFRMEGKNSKTATITFYNSISHVGKFISSPSKCFVKSEESGGTVAPTLYNCISGDDTADDFSGSGNFINKTRTADTLERSLAGLGGFGYIQPFTKDSICFQAGYDFTSLADATWDLIKYDINGVLRDRIEPDIGPSIVYTDKTRLSVLPTVKLRIAAEPLQEKELLPGFRVIPYHITEGDYGVLRVSLIDVDGSAVDLTDANSVVFKVKENRFDTTYVINATMVIDDVTGGKVYYAFEGNEFTSSGKYIGEVSINWNSGDVTTAERRFQITVHPEL